MTHARLSESRRAIRIRLLAVAASASVPLACLAFGGSRLWPVTTALLAYVLVGLCSGLPSRTARVASAVASGGVIAFGNALLGASLYIQGDGFNHAFFYHLEPGLVHAGVGDYFGQIVLVVLYCIVTIAVFAGAAWRRVALRPGRAVVLAACTLGIAPVFQPVFEIGSHAFGGWTQPAVSIDPQALSDVFEYRVPEERPNLVFIYGEGMERNFFDAELFPGLTPNLSSFAEGNIRFDSIHQHGPSGFTMGGIVASQCGWPLYSAIEVQNMNQISTYSNFLSRMTCLGDVLDENGYNLIFMGGADSRFAGKGNFFTSHGYDTIVDRNSFAATASGDTGFSNWGVRDGALFRHARERIRALAERPEPFALTLINVDTHQPDGIPTAGCDGYAGMENPMLDAVHCADRVMGSFIRDVTSMEMSRDTVIVFMSDHLAMRNTATSRLAEKTPRKLMLVIDTPGGPADVISRPGTHYDVAPTILDAMGFESGDPFGLGRSLLAGRGYLHEITRHAPEPGQQIEVILAADAVKRTVRDKWHLADLNLFDAGNIRLDGSGLLVIGGAEFNLRWRGVAHMIPVVFEFTPAGDLAAARTFDHKIVDDAGSNLFVEAIRRVDSGYVLAIAGRGAFRGQAGFPGAEGRLAWIFASGSGHYIKGSADAHSGMQTLAELPDPA